MLRSTTTSQRASGGQAGLTLAELLIAVALIALVASIAVPSLTVSLEASRTWGAARYLGGRFALARSEAVRRSAFVAVRIVPEGNSYRLAFVADGNRNGIRTSEIAALIDRIFGPSERLDDKFNGVTFGILAGVTAVDSNDLLAAGGDPVRFGQSSLASFNPDGSATAGTVYICSAHYQAAVRVLGITGRTRVLWFDFARRQWVTR